MTFHQAAPGSWVSDDGRFEVYFTLDGGKAAWAVWDREAKERIDDASHKTRAKATEWLLGDYLARA